MNKRALRAGLVFGSVSGFIILVSVIISIIVLSTIPHECRDLVDDSIESIVGDENEENEGGEVDKEGDS